jgi:hypothetical protein
MVSQINKGLPKTWSLYMQTCTIHIINQKTNILDYKDSKQQKRKKPKQTNLHFTLFCMVCSIFGAWGLQ